MSIKPGITGMWQVSGRSDITDFEEVVKLDTEYIEKNAPDLVPLYKISDDMGMEFATASLHNSFYFVEAKNIIACINYRIQNRKRDFDLYKIFLDTFSAEISGDLKKIELIERRCCSSKRKLQ